MWTGTPAPAHKLDEYLQATILQVDKDCVQSQLYLTPGVTIFPKLLISATEQRDYEERVLGDLSLSIDGEPLRLRLASANFIDIEELKQGRGAITLEVFAHLPRGSPKRKLIFENHHEIRIAAYLVNCWMPRDPDIRTTAQKRSHQQSLYELSYVQDGMPQGPLPLWSPGTPVLAGTAALLLLVQLVLKWRQRAPTAVSDNGS